MVHLRDNVATEPTRVVFAGEDGGHLSWSLKFEVWQ